MLTRTESEELKTLFNAAIDAGENADDDLGSFDNAMNAFWDKLEQLTEK